MSNQVKTSHETKRSIKLECRPSSETEMSIGTKRPIMDLSICRAVCPVGHSDVRCPHHGPNATWGGGGQRPLGNGTGTRIRVTVGGACPLRRHKIGVLSRPSGLQQEEGRRGHSGDTRSKGKARSSRRRPARAGAKAGGPRTSKCGPRPGLGRRGGGETRGIFGELVPPAVLAGRTAMGSVRLGRRSSPSPSTCDAVGRGDRRARLPILGPLHEFEQHPLP